MKKILVTLLAFVAFSVFAQDEWVLLSTSKDNLYKIEGKKGSFKVGEKSGMIVTRAIIKGKNPTYNLILMSKEDCSAGFGKVQYFTTSFEFSYSQDYVYGGGTIAQNVGDLICDLLNKPNV